MTRPRILHLACMPFPSPQGTQAAVRAMVEALVRSGHDVSLLAYAHGAGGLPPSFPLLRGLPLPVGRSLRSGPSLGKIALDTAMVAEVALRTRRDGYGLVVAHNVEAALVAAAANVPHVTFAHTAMETELAHYGPRWASYAADRAGFGLDRLALARSLGVAAISPTLALALARRHGARARFVPTPWPLPAPITESERRSARLRLDLPGDARALLFAGNLDAYQGLGRLLDALATLPPEVRLLVATASEPAPFVREARARGVDGRLHLLPLGTEDDRRLAHAAADVAVVPRIAEGGLPIKLLDALARGLPVVATRAAAAGLDLAGAALVAPNDTLDSFALVLRAALASRSLPEIAERGRAFVAERFSESRFVAAYDRVVDEALTARPGSPGARPRRDG